jgi:hypothetical protein
MKKILVVLALFIVFSLAGYAGICSTTAPCPQDGETALGTGNTKPVLGGGWTAEYKHKGKDKAGKEFVHTFWKVCD